jgi:hypothetical protein
LRIAGLEYFGRDDGHVNVMTLYIRDGFVNGRHDPGSGSDFSVTASRGIADTQRAGPVAREKL